MSLVSGIRAELGGCADPPPTQSFSTRSWPRAGPPCPARVLRVDPRDADLAGGVAPGLRVDATLDTWGGVELASDDGRTVRNTLEERLANAEPACSANASPEVK